MIKFIISIAIIIAIGCCYKLFDYNNIYIYPQKTKEIMINNRYSVDIFCSAEWVKNTYGPPYAVNISIANIKKADIVEIEFFQIKYNDVALPVPMRREERFQNDNTMQFRYKYINMDLNDVTTITYELKLKINDEIYNIEITTDIENRIEKNNKLLLPFQQ